MATVFRISIVQRVSALGALCVALALALALVFASQRWEERSVARAELAGLPATNALLKLATLTAEHRGMSAGFLAGNDEFRARREAKQTEVNAAVDAVLAETRGWQSTRLERLRNSLRDEWPLLARGVADRTVDAKSSFVRHSELIQRQLALIDEVVAVSTMALDPEAVTYYLIASLAQFQPVVTEAVGQMRGFGAGMLARPTFAEVDKAFIAGALASSRRAFDAAQLSIERAIEAEPALRIELEPRLLRAREEFEKAARTVDEAILRATAPAMQGTVYFATVTKAIEAHAELSAVSFTLLRDALQARADKATRAAFVMSALTALLLVASIWMVVAMVRTIRRNADAAVATARALASGDFTATLGSRGHDEFARIAQSLEDARLQMSNAIGEVRGGVDAIATASQQIAQGSLDLSRRTEQQASALQETAASMEQLTGAVQASRDNASQANQMAHSASDVAQRGGEAMDRIVTTMGEIAESSRKVSNIVGVIDGIAFQTNILALNAAVEAARAGEQGRGFAVVAAEVRALAQRSAQAAREIKSMIASSAESVESGGELVGSAGQNITGIVGQVQRVTDLIAEISAAASEQTRGIEQVGVAVTMLDQATQQNSALAEESAAAAESLRVQSERVSKAVGVFRLAPGA